MQPSEYIMKKLGENLVPSDYEVISYSKEVHHPTYYYEVTLINRNTSAKITLNWDDLYYHETPDPDIRILG